MEEAVILRGDIKLTVNNSLMQISIDSWGSFWWTDNYELRKYGWPKKSRDNIFVLSNCTYIVKELNLAIKHVYVHISYSLAFVSC